MTKIYVLVDPTTDQVRYVGKTQGTLYARLRGHIEKSRNLKHQWYSARWIRSLTSEGLTPIIELIREVADEYANETEVFCIAEYKRMGCALTNGTTGGDGGVTGTTLHSAESIRKRVERLRSIDTGITWRGKKQPQELIDKRNAWRTPEANAAVARKARETRARRKAVAGAFGVDLYRREHSEARKEADRRRWEMTPEDRKQEIADKVRQHWASLSEVERGQKVAEFQRNADEYRRKITAGEVIDPRLGRTPWNKGIDQGPEVGIKSWETKRANGFVSQREMLQEIADGCGHSVSKVERALKGYSSKVSKVALDEIWVYYEDNKLGYPNLTVVYP